MLVSYPTFGCPTCVGRLMIGVDKPFFEQHKPEPINKRQIRKQQKKDRIKQRANFAAQDFWIRLKKQFAAQDFWIQLKKQIKNQRLNGSIL